MTSVFDVLPPPPAPGVDPATGIASYTVPGGFTTGQTRRLVPTGDGHYQEGDGAGNWIGPKIPATFPAHLPPKDLLGPGLVCRPDGMGGIVCESPPDRPSGAASSGFLTGAGAPPPASTPTYSRTQGVFDDLARQNADLQAQINQVRYDEQALPLGASESIEAMGAAEGPLSSGPQEPSRLPSGAIVVLGVGVVIVAILFFGLGGKA